MRVFPVLLGLSVVGLFNHGLAADAGVVPAPSRLPAAPLSYEAFCAAIETPQALAEFIERSDKLIDAVDGPAASPGGKTVILSTGLRLDFSVSNSADLVFYHLAVSRNGQEMHYSEAVKLAALFADRAILGHPIDVTEGEKPIFHCQWLFQPKDFKKLRKKMLTYRQQVRVKQDPLQVYSIAIEREQHARASAGGR